jgi:hypothetical protein
LESLYSTANKNIPYCTSSGNNRATPAGVVTPVVVGVVVVVPPVVVGLVVVVTPVSAFISETKKNKTKSIIFPSAFALKQTF